jgi:hypothetical protein
VTLGVAVPRARQVPLPRIDHRPWDALLKNRVDGRGDVDYAGWQRSSADQAELDRYLDHLSTAAVEGDWPAAARLAYWINAYNAVTIKGILREYPTTSIRNHTAQLWGYNIWRDLQLQVAGRPYSLDAIEHEVLRKLAEPRVHFAIVCASRGCPRLRNEAYTAERLEAQLTDNARSFFADRTRFTYDREAGAFRLSPILKWFAEDFGADRAAQLRAIAPYLPAAAQPAARSGSVRVTFLEYDWRLNDQAGPDQESQLDQ